MYARPDVVLMDDPLSAVDAHVGRHLFKHCIAGPAAALHGTTRLFATNQIYLLNTPAVDRIVVLDGGRIVEQVGRIAAPHGAHSASASRTRTLRTVHSHCSGRRLVTRAVVALALAGVFRHADGLGAPGRSGDKRRRHVQAALQRGHCAHGRRGRRGGGRGGECR